MHVKPCFHRQLYQSMHHIRALVLVRGHKQKTQPTSQSHRHIKPCHFHPDRKEKQKCLVGQVLIYGTIAGPAGGYCVLTWSNEICHMIPTALGTSGSRLRSPPSWLRREFCVGSLWRKQVKYMEAVVRGAFMVMYTAAWLMASSKYSSAWAHAFQSSLTDVS